MKSFWIWVFTAFLVLNALANGSLEQFSLDRVDCKLCGQKIKMRVAQLKGVGFVEVDIERKTLTVDAVKWTPELENQIQTIIDEPAAHGPRFFNQE